MSESVPERKDNPVDALPKGRLRLIILAVGDHWVEGRSRYERDWSDERVAEELDLSPSIVQRVREEYFGEIKANPKVLALENTVRTLRSELTALQRLIEEAENEYRTLAAAGEDT